MNLVSVMMCAHGMGNIAIKQHGAPGGGVCLYVNEL